ncbi:hypothetical protein [Sphingomonas sp. AX6]|uniref:hypothetical protein n=1 Tax=Sphingomonas sp. AX6 TaxID=2653171 RepID=UPI0012F174DF|nr:hypothetical protein [Sphingomonas sp. AX6]VXD00848.1 conserved hypothetical protein [Sphingomonas sp. AX6]
MFQLIRSPTAPTRLIGRLAAEMVLHILVRTRHHFGGALDGGSTYDRVAIVLMLLRYARLPFPDQRDAPRAISVSGIAASMGMPFETTRRHVGRLIDHGLAQRDSGGVVLCPDLCDRPDTMALLREFHDVMIGHIADLARFDIPLPITRVDIDYRPVETLIVLLDTTLFLFERNRSLYGSALTAVVGNAIIAANVRHLTYDADLAPRYARLDTIPPDSLRVPVRVSRLAAVLGVPHSTVRRDVGRLVDRDLVSVERGGRLVVRQQQLASAMLTDNNRLALLRAVQIVQRLKLGGCRFDRPDHCYLDGRRAPLSFD